MRLAGASPTYQFQALTTTGPPEDRVDGYEQAFAYRTPAVVAKAEVLKLLPSDTYTTSFSIEHTGTGSCAFWNVKSKTLGQWFAGPTVGDAAGAVGVEFRDTNESEFTYSPTSVSRAIVNTAPATKGTNC